MVDDQNFKVDLFISVAADANMREVSREVQQRVSRTVHEIVGMDVAAINVHIEDVDFDESDGVS